MINNNAEITKQLKKGFGFSELTTYPRRVSEAILPVVDVNKKYCNVVRSTTLIAPTTLYTTPTNKDFYICSAYASVSPKNDSENGTRIVTATIDNQSQVIIQASAYAVTAANGTPAVSNSINPIYPIKIDRGTNIVVSGAGTYGTAGIIGYTEDIPGD